MYLIFLLEINVDDKILAIQGKFWSLTFFQITEAEVNKITLKSGYKNKILFK